MHALHSTCGRGTRLLCGLALLLATLGCVGRPLPSGKVLPGQLQAYGFERDAMGTRFRIVLFTGDGRESARAAAAAAFQCILDLERVASDWRAESELSQAGRIVAQKGEVELSPLLASLFSLCEEMRERSGGRFDPAIGTATRLWRRAARQGEEPSGEDLELLREGGDLPWRLEGMRLFLPSGSTSTTVRFDLGAVAKGAALDLALAELESRGIRSAMVEGGGDLLCGDAPPESSGWQIEMAPGSVFGEGGTESDESPWLVVSQAGVATSGSRARGGWIGGSYRSHLVDTSSQEALGRVDSERGREEVAACVIVPRAGVGRPGTDGAGARADALATVLCLLPESERPRFLQESGNFSARIWRRDPPGPTQLRSSPTFELYVLGSDSSPHPSTP